MLAIPGNTLLLLQLTAFHPYKKHLFIMHANVCVCVCVSSVRRKGGASLNNGGLNDLQEPPAVNVF